MYAIHFAAGAPGGKSTPQKTTAPKSTGAAKPAMGKGTAKNADNMGANAGKSNTGGQGMTQQNNWPDTGQKNTRDTGK